MPMGGLQDELDYILGRRTQRYWVAYLLGIPTLFIYTLVWMANIAEERAGHRGTAYVVVAYVRLEHVRCSTDGTSSRHLALLRYAE